MTVTTSANIPTKNVDPALVTWLSQLRQDVANNANDVKFEIKQYAYSAKTNPKGMNISSTTMKLKGCLLIASNDTASFSLTTNGNGIFVYTSTSKVASFLVTFLLIGS